MKTSLSFPAMAIKGSMPTNKTEVSEVDGKNTNEKIVFVRHHNTIIFAGLFIGPDVKTVFVRVWDSKVTRQRLNAVANTLNLPFKFYSKNYENMAKVNGIDYASNDGFFYNVDTKKVNVWKKRTMITNEYDLTEDLYVV